MDEFASVASISVKCYKTAEVYEDILFVNSQGFRTSVRYNVGLEYYAVDPRLSNPCGRGL